MLAYALRRLLVSLPLALGAVTLVFVLLETAPGEPLDALLGDHPVPPEVRERLEAAWGLDRPPTQRYVQWLKLVIVEGDLGWSHSRSRPVTQVLRQALPPTLLLAAAAMLCHLVVGLLAGCVAASWPRRWPDRIASTTTLILYAMPPFWIALMAVLLLAHLWPVFPASSTASIGADGWGPWRQLADRLWHLVLPALVLGLSSAGVLMRFVRNGLLDALERDFTRAARARGLSPRSVLLRHALRPALRPVAQWLGLALPALVSGSLVIEVIFAWPGMGRATYEAIRAQDQAVVLASTLIVSLLAIAGSLAADLSAALLDPRIRSCFTRRVSP